MGYSIAIHTNVNLEHQVRHAKAFERGFARHGLIAHIATERSYEADLHICMGPHFALKQNIGERVFYLDRAYWGDPTHVSLTWLDTDGNKVFNWGRGGDRYHPELHPYRKGTNAVVLCDYGMDGKQDRDLALPFYSKVDIRRHPSEVKDQNTLADCLSRYHIAIGRHSTAMVEAAIMGLAVVCRTEHSAVTPIASRCVRDIRTAVRDNWIKDLAGHNWAITEIESGEAWDNLYH